MLTKISKVKANELYERDIAVCVVPCKIDKDNENFYKFVDCLEKDYKFNDIVSYYRKMNCNEQNGKQLHFYCEENEVQE